MQACNNKIIINNIVLGIYKHNPIEKKKQKNKKIKANTAK